MTAPAVSICIPAYNRPEQLRRLLDSVLSQDFTDYEVIVTDDSPDATVSDAVAGYSDSRLFYFKNTPAQGTPANWNAAIQRARGVLIKVMHDDDWLASTSALRDFVTALTESPNAAMAFCVSEIRQIDTGKVRFNRPTPRFLEQLKNDPREVFFGNLIGAPSAVIFRKTATLFDERLTFLVDVDFYISMLRQGEFVFIDRPLIVNTAGDSSQVTARSFTSRIQLGESITVYNKHFTERFPSLRMGVLFIRLFRDFEFPGFDVLSEWRVAAPRPLWFFRGLWRAGRLWRILRG